MSPARELALKYLTQAREDHRDIKPPYKPGYKTFNAAAGHAARDAAYLLTLGSDDAIEMAEAWMLLSTAATRVVGRRHRDRERGAR